MASMNGSKYNAPEPPSNFDIDSTFTEISILFAHAEQFAKGYDLIIWNHPKSSFTSKDWPFSTPFPEVKVPLRGCILCSPESNGSNSGSVGVSHKAPAKASNLSIPLNEVFIATLMERDCLEDPS